MIHFISSSFYSAFSSSVRIISSSFAGASTTGSGYRCGSGKGFALTFKKFDFIWLRSGIVKSAISYPMPFQTNPRSSLHSLTQTKSTKSYTSESGTSIYLVSV